MDNYQDLTDYHDNKKRNFLKTLVDIHDAKDKPSVSNQGQCMDGYSQFYNYNMLAKKVKKYLEENKHIG